MSVWDDESGYDLDDPKHPTFADRYADWADIQRKREKENAFDDYDQEGQVNEGRV
jgi:hypothetical protein